jgi:hypothetical protein
MSKFFDKYVFQIQQLLKTSRPGVSLPKVVLYKFDKKELCVFHTLNEFIDRTLNLRKSNKLLISYHYKDIYLLVYTIKNSKFYQQSCTLNEQHH